MRTRGLITLAVVTSALVVSCSVDPTVTAERSDQIASPQPTETTPANTGPATTAPETTDPSQDDPTGTDPTVTEPTDPTPTDPTSTAPSPSVAPDEIDPTAIDFGPNKTPHDYDDFLLAVMTDLDSWWSEQYPGVYGDAFQSLSGGVYAAYPNRPDDLPGCGEPRTTYDEVQQFVAFYCGQGDFIIYDDGDEGLLAQLAGQYGPGTIGIVFAHEFGHAIQTRAGALDRDLPTVYTEQQADCFAGAWAGRVSRGESSIVSFSDADVRSGFIAMTKVSDPVGLNQFVEGGHGSAFDRVGAFQVGFNEGVARCAELLDSPLPLSLNQFSETDFSTGGNAPLGYDEGELLEFIPTDLNLYWNDEVGAETGSIGDLTLVGATSAGEVECDDGAAAFELGAAYCASTNTVFVNDLAVQEIYDALGDFSVGYLLGTAWSEAVQQSLGSELEGEDRALLNDCLTGAWVKTTVPVDNGTGGLALPEPRAAERTASVSAGDLDEAIQTIIGISDESSDENVRGGLFEKIDAFRQGVVEGLDSCLADL
jgi:predicted metalloprotease